MADNLRTEGGLDKEFMASVLKPSRMVWRHSSTLGMGYSMDIGEEPMLHLVIFPDRRTVEVGKKKLGTSFPDSIPFEGITEVFEERGILCARVDDGSSPYTEVLLASPTGEYLITRIRRGSPLPLLPEPQQNLPSL